MKQNIKQAYLHGGDIYSEGILKGETLIDFSSNINPLGVPKSFKDNINEALQRVIRYPDIQYRELCHSIRDYIKEFPVKEGTLLLGNGAAEIIDLAISSLKSILLIVPSFVEYEIDAERWHCEIEYSFLKDNMDLNYEDIFLKVKRVQGLIIGNPNNPNGSVIDKEKFKPILEYCEKQDKLIIIDEAFIEFTGDENMSYTKELQNYKCLFIIRALTKFFALPGIRFGYGMSSNTDLIENLKKRQNPWNINCFAETAAKYVLKDSKYIEASNKWISEEREYLTKGLQKVGFIDIVYPTQSNYLLCKLKNIDCHELYSLCLNRGLLIRKADNFKGLDNTYVRFAIKDRKLNEFLLETLKELRV